MEFFIVLTNASAEILKCESYGHFTLSWGHGRRSVDASEAMRLILDAAKVTY